MITAQQYSTTADELTNRIIALMREHPEVKELDAPHKLFQYRDFQCDDLQPSLFQAQWALAKAKRHIQMND